jgi:hypothetical protein
MLEPDSTGGRSRSILLSYATCYLWKTGYIAGLLYMAGAVVDLQVGLGRVRYGLVWNEMKGGKF